MTQTFFNLEDKKTWQNTLGLLPTNFLFNSKSQFVMQNGNINNFCIDVESLYETKQYQHYSWASDTNCFLKISNNKISIYRWDKIDVVEILNFSDFNEALLVKLYKYIGGFTQPREKSIVAIIMDLFGKLRNSSGSRDGLSALNSLLYLLAKTNEFEPDYEKWGIDTDSIKDLPSQFNTIYGDFQKRVNIEKDTTKILLRHVSGRLFQEAHYQAILNPQLDIYGQPSPSNKLVRNAELVGVHFTPAFITRSIVEESLRRFNFEGLNEIKILDPACGSGEFLKEALRQIVELHPQFNGTIRLYGWDKSLTAIKVAKFSLNFEKSQNLGRKIEINIVEKDSLIEEWGLFDIILMNPPFVAWELLDNSTQCKVQSALGKFSVNKPNLASPFFYKAICSLTSNGVLGCVLPFSVFNADSYKSLRKFSLENLFIELIGKLGNLNLFYNAVVDAGIFVAINLKVSNESLTVLWADNSLNSTTDALRTLRLFQLNPTIPVNEKNFSLYTLPQSTIEYPKVVSYFSKQLESKLLILIQQGSLVFIEDIFEVKQGARTGANSSFLISSNTYFSLLVEKERKYFKPVITNRAINNGVIKIMDYLWYPYGNKKIYTEFELKKNLPNYYEMILLPNRLRLQKRSEVMQQKYAWWELTRERSWQSDMPKLVSTEFGKSGYFGYDSNGEFLVEGGNAWFIRREKSEEADINQDDLNYAYLAFFCSPFFNELLSVYSKQIAGGQFYLGGKFVNPIPIPDFTNPDLTPFFSPLIEFGKKIASVSLKKEDESFITNIVKDIYKL